MDGVSAVAGLRAGPAALQRQKGGTSSGGGTGGSVSVSGEGDTVQVSVLARAKLEATSRAESSKTDSGNGVLAEAKRQAKAASQGNENSHAGSLVNAMQEWEIAIKTGGKSRSGVMDAILEMANSPQSQSVLENTRRSVEGGSAHSLRESAASKQPNDTPEIRAMNNPELENTINTMRGFFAELKKDIDKKIHPVLRSGLSSRAAA